MDDRRFDAELAAVAAGLKARRGECPETSQLADHARGGLTGAAAERVREHLRLCTACRELAEAALADPAEIDEVTWRRASRRLDSRPAPWRRRTPHGRRTGWLAAAAVVLAAGLSGWLAVSRPAPERPERVAATRGAVIQLVEPVGEVGELEVFRWQAPPLAVTYRVELRRGDHTVWSEVSPFPLLEAPPELRRELVPGVAYRWRVEGVDDAGRAVVTSDWAELRLRPPGG